MNFTKLAKTTLTAYTGWYVMTWNLGDASWKKCRGINHITDNAVQVTGEHSHVPYPAKIEVKQAVAAAPSRSTQSRHAPWVIMQETHATLSQEVFAEIRSYSFIQRMIQRRNLNLIQDGSAGWSCHTCPSLMKLAQLYLPKRRSRNKPRDTLLGFCRHQRYDYFDYVCKIGYSRPS